MKSKDVDFTEDEITLIQKAEPSDYASIAEDMNTTIGSIKAMKRHIGGKRSYNRRAAKVAPSITTVKVPTMSNKLIIRHNGSTILLDKEGVTGITFEGNDVTIHKGIA